MPHGINLDYINYKPYLKELSNLNKIFKKLKISMCLHGGTLLGAVRNNDFIDGDDDIDVFYISKQSNKYSVLKEFNEKIAPILEKNGYEIKPIFWTVHNKKRQLFGQYHFIKNNIELDVWIAWKSNNKFFLTPGCYGELDVRDIHPLKKIKLKNENFLVPNKAEKLLQMMYGDNWKVPAKTRGKINYNFFNLKVLKLIDSYGWAYHFIAKSQQKYSIHQIDYLLLKDFDLKMLDDYDILYMPSPGLSNASVNKIIRDCNSKYPRIKIIGAYAGENKLKYDDGVNLLISISSKYLPNVKSFYPDKSTIFLPECTDANFFPVKKLNDDTFVVGYAGRTNKIKRLHLMDKLNYTVKKQTNHSTDFLKKDSTLEPMKEFYNSLDCFILTSSSECMPGVILEAMATGLPVVSTDVGSINLLLEKEWLIPSEPEELVVEEMNKKLTLLKNNPELRKEVGKRNRKHIEMFFNWENNQTLWDEVFSSLYCNDYTKIKELTEDYYSQFKILQDLNSIILVPEKLPDLAENKPIISNPGLKIRTCDVIKSINQLGINFWLLNRTCLEAVVKNELITNKLSIGVGGINDKELIGNQLARYSSFLDVTVEYRKTTKPWTLYDIHTQVPCPVVDYLEKTFNKKWNELKNE